MAKTRDYMDYLDESVDIAPANSQEEYQAAETIADVLRDHDLETSIEEFDAHPWETLVAPVTAVLLLVLLVVGGVTDGAVHVLCLLLSLALAGLTLFMHFTGNNLLENIGPTSRSQNVVAVHRAEGDKVVKGSRPIVIVAHYDTPRQNLLYTGPFAHFQSTLRSITIPCYIAVAVSALFQIMGFLPAILRTIMLVVGLIALLPLVALAVVDIQARFAPCTVGSNDNKSSVAALLSLANKVRPAEDRVSGNEEEGKTERAARRRVRRAGDAKPAPAAPRQVEVVEEVHGVRHGAEVLSSLGILPPECEIVYQEPRVQVVEEPVEAPRDEQWESDDLAKDQDSEAKETENKEVHDEDVRLDYKSADEADEDEDASKDDSQSDDKEERASARRTVAPILPPLVDDEWEDDEGAYEDDADADFEDEYDDQGDDDVEEYDDYDDSGYEDEDSYDEDDEDWEGGSGIGLWFSGIFSNIKDRFASRRNAQESDDDVDEDEEYDEDYEDSDDYGDGWMDYDDEDEEVEDDQDFEDYDEEQEEDYEEDQEEYDDEVEDDFEDEEYDEATEDDYEDYEDEGYDEDDAPAEQEDFEEADESVSQEVEGEPDSEKPEDRALLSVPEIEPAAEPSNLVGLVASLEDDAADAADTVAEDAQDEYAADDEDAFAEEAEDEGAPADEEEDDEQEGVVSSTVAEADADDVAAYDDADEYEEYEESEYQEDDESYDEEYDEDEYLEEDYEDQGDYEDDEEAYEDEEYEEEYEAAEEDYDDEDAYEDEEYEGEEYEEYDEGEVEEEDEEYEYEERPSLKDRIVGFFSKIRMGEPEESDVEYNEYGAPIEDEYEDDYEDQYEDDYDYEDQGVFEEAYDEDDFYEEEYAEEVYEGSAEDDSDYEDEVEDERYEPVPTSNPYMESEYEEEPYEENVYEGEMIDDEVYEEEFDGEYEEQYEDEYVDAREDEFVDVELDFDDDLEEDYEPAYEPAPRAEEPQPQPLSDPNLLHFDREEDADIAPRDTTGLDMISDSYDLYTSQNVQAATRERPAPLEDPYWGVTSYQPSSPAMNIARRAALFDLPDPSAAAIDPLDDGYDEYDDYEDEYVDDGLYEEVPADEYQGSYSQQEVYSSENEKTGPIESEDAWAEEPQQNSQDNGSTQSGFWGVSSKKSDWKGGATTREDLRNEGDEPLVIDADDLQDAILELGDEYLISHDIWFVATGASEVNHAGIRAFIEEHRRDIRGAFLVNLDSVGSGALSVIVREGLHEPRRADRRLVRMITGIAQDLHIQMDTAAYNWDERESATAMRSRVRSVTIAGLDENNLPAYSHTSADLPENVDPRQVSDVVRIVTELIRRS